MNHLLSVEAIYDGGKIKIPEVNIHRPCKVIITFLVIKADGKIGSVDKSVLGQVKENIKRWLTGEKK
ncbi:MAG: hypothetical protein J7K81_05610 [Methanophagales archaeon]|nr:hypothetical protein [Methanophagales archaeon]